MSPRGIAVSNTRYLSSISETRVNAGIKGWKLHLSESTWCQESVGGICFTYKWRAASLQPLTFSKHCKKCSIFKCISWLNGLFIFFGWTSGFCEREGQDLSNGANVASQLVNLFFCLHIFRLRGIPTRCDTYGGVREFVKIFCNTLEAALIEVDRSNLDQLTFFWFSSTVNFWTFSWKRGFYHA